MIGGDNGLVIKGTAIISDIRYMEDDAQKDSVLQRFVLLD